MTPIQLIVGLGNPGPNYSETRHNAGAWIAAAIAEKYHAQFRSESKFKALVTDINEQSKDCKIAIPTTFMNLSGDAVQAIVNFFKIPVDAILVAHDELDLSPGEIRLKQGGGHGGHNGLRDIMAKLNSDQFVRLRIGIGHPGKRDLVTPYVLNKPTRDEAHLIEDALTRAMNILPLAIAGDLSRAMQTLHTKINPIGEL